MPTTTIEVDHSTYQKLNSRKSRPGMSFDDVLRGMFDEIAELRDRVDELEDAIDQEVAIDEPGDPTDTTGAIENHSSSGMGPATGEVEAIDEPDELDVDEAIDRLDLPGSRQKIEARRDAVRACYDLLCSEGEARRSVYQTEVYPDHEAGYKTADGWWNTIQPALKELASYVDAIEAPGPGENEWRYRS